MRHSLALYSSALLVCLLAHITAPAFAQPAARTLPAESRAERALAQASQQGRFAFLLFYRQQDAATDAMVAALKQNLADKSEMATITYVQIGDSAEQALVKKYGVGRAPMPLAIALAPNGAITAIHPGRLAEETFDDAFVTPAGAESLKALQEKKIVFVTVRDSSRAGEPSVIAAFANDPHFRERMNVISVDANDAAEREFLAELQFDAGASPVPALVVLAPPGVLVGRFSASTTKDQIAAAIAEAGKCCDDPSCKHHKKR